MAKDLIGYDRLVNDALRGVMIHALDRAASKGISGNHRFYITFRTDIPGVVLSDDLRARYPEEMTMVLQYQFWDLDVGDDAFSVTLTFNKVPQRLTVPFAAVTAFVDPGVKFRLQFKPPDEREAEATARRPPPAKAAKPAARGKARKPESKAGTPEGGQVIALDSFRKK
ncbi:MAG: SspB family protein [Alphaproteobacteria bacterium]